MYMYVKRDSVIYWKTQGKIKNDLQSYICIYIYIYVYIHIYTYICIHIYIER